jgi:hypothetical protein
MIYKNIGSKYKTKLEIVRVHYSFVQSLLIIFSVFSCSVLVRNVLNIYFFSRK